MAQISDNWTLYEAAHLLNRAGFGGSPAEVAQLHQRGRLGAVAWLLAGEEKEPLAQPKWTSQFEERRDEAMEQRKALKGLKGLEGEERERKEREMRRAQLRNRRERSESLLSWWLEKMRTTEAPLREKMTLFWHDHFPSHILKVREPQYMFDQNELFRSQALGNFGKLIQKVAIDPAMMLYLDSSLSSKKKPNENFARELLELFTLGEGNYTEGDVKEAARAFTGYRLNRATGETRFLERQWDEGEKTILGKTGSFKGEDVVALALAHPQCGPYLAKKIWEFFAYENPDPELVARLGKKFAQSDYELQPLLREIFLSEEFYSEAAMRTQIKSPLSFVVMMSRQLETGRIEDRVLVKALTQLGQIPFRPPNVAGWDWGKAWVNTNTLITRYHFAGFVTGASDELTKVFSTGKKMSKAKRKKRRSDLPRLAVKKLVSREEREDSAALVAALAFRIFQAPLSAKDQVAFENYAQAKEGEAFSDDEIAELMHLMMSTPTYQLT